MICAHGHDEALVERIATPEEVDIGCELGVAYDPCPDCARDRADAQELSWWRHFATKLTPDSQLPEIGTPLLGHRYRVTSDSITQQRFGSRFTR